MTATIAPSTCSPAGDSPAGDPRPARRVWAAITLILGLQALGFGAAGVAAFSGNGSGSTALSLGAGLFLLTLGGIAGGIALGVSEGSPAARDAVPAFEGLVGALVLLWLAPPIAIVGTALTVVTLTVAHRLRRSAIAASPS